MKMKPMIICPRDGTFVVLFLNSGYKTTRLRAVVAHWDSQFRPRQPWIDHAGDSIFDGGGNIHEIRGWIPVPEEP